MKIFLFIGEVLRRFHCPDEVIVVCRVCETLSVVETQLNFLAKLSCGNPFLGNHELIWSHVQAVNLTREFRGKKDACRPVATSYIQHSRRNGGFEQRGTLPQHLDLGFPGAFCSRIEPAMVKVFSPEQSVP